MVSLKEIENFLDYTLHCDAIKDYCPNGVQVRGVENVTRIVTGVSACMELFEAANRLKADFVLVHHGMFWNSDSRVVEGGLKRRLAFLLEHDMNLLAYHLPLDRHAEIGNNALILKRLMLEPTEPFGYYNGKPISFIAQSQAPIPFSFLTARIQGIFGGEPLVLPFGPDKIRRVAVCSGAAPELVREAVAKGADLFISGEATEWVYHYAKEEGIHYVAAGHHRTEMFGIEALGELVATKFKLEHHFINIDNPI